MHAWMNLPAESVWVRRWQVPVRELLRMSLYEGGLASTLQVRRAGLPLCVIPLSAGMQG
jgi:hypothetical protein